MTLEGPVPDDRRGPVFLSALLGALARPPIWLVTWLVPLLLGLSVGLPWVGWVDGVGAERLARGAELQGWSETFRTDHAAELAALRGRSAETAAALGLLAMLFGVFAAGGWLQVFLERTEGHSVRRFLWGGSRYFWRFARVWLLTLALLAAVSWIALGWPWNTLVRGFLVGVKNLEELTSERSAVWFGWVQDGLYALFFALVLVWADYTRTRLALLDTRSALVAGLAAATMLARHPLQTIRPLALLFALEVLLLLGAGKLVQKISAGLDASATWHDLALLLLIGELALLWRAITRGARYHAAVQVSHAIVPPLSRPDPWAHRIGGPGGPQYPIDATSDEYGVSL
jgi:hypothetical protein